jgi:hypothetical protein
LKAVSLSATVCRCSFIEINKLYYYSKVLLLHVSCERLGKNWEQAILGSREQDILVLGSRSYYEYGFREQGERGFMGAGSITNLVAGSHSL